MFGSIVLCSVAIVWLPMDRHRPVCCCFFCSSLFLWMCYGAGKFCFFNEMFKCVFDWMVCSVCFFLRFRFCFFFSTFVGVSMLLLLYFTFHLSLSIQSHAFRKHGTRPYNQPSFAISKRFVIWCGGAVFRFPLFIHFSLFFQHRLRSFFYSWLIFHMVRVWVHEHPKANLNAMGNLYGLGIFFRVALKVETVIYFNLKFGFWQRFFELEKWSFFSYRIFDEVFSRGFRSVDGIIFHLCEFFS